LKKLNNIFLLFWLTTTVAISDQIDGGGYSCKERSLPEKYNSSSNKTIKKLEKIWDYKIKTYQQKKDKNRKGINLSNEVKKIVQNYVLFWSKKNIKKMYELYDTEIPFYGFKERMEEEFKWAYPKEILNLYTPDFTNTGMLSMCVVKVSIKKIKLKRQELSNFIVFCLRKNKKDNEWKIYQQYVYWNHSDFIKQNLNLKVETLIKKSIKINRDKLLQVNDKIKSLFHKGQIYKIFNFILSDYKTNKIFKPIFFDLFFLFKSDDSNSFKILNEKGPFLVSNDQGWYYVKCRLKGLNKEYNNYAILIAYSKNKNMQWRISEFNYEKIS